MISGAQLMLDRRVFVMTLAVLLPLDLLDVVLHLGHAAAVAGWGPRPLESWFFDMNRELGFGEDIEYVKTAAAAVALAICAWRTRVAVFAMLSGLYTWLVFDNALALHERFGRDVAHRVFHGPVPGFWNNSAPGELIVFAAIGLAAIVAFVFSLRRIPAAVVPTALAFAGAVLCMPVFGVLVDAFHGMSIAARFNGVALTVLEDGGETLALSLNCALAVACVFHSAMSGTRLGGAPQTASSTAG